MKCDLHGLAANIKATIDSRRGDMRYMVDVMVEHIEKLEAIAAALPKTADGVPIVPGMDLYVTGVWGSFIYEMRTFQRKEWDGTPYIEGMMEENRTTGFPAAKCYSTREGAEAAVKAAQPNELLDDERPQQNEPAAAPQNG